MSTPRSASPFLVALAACALATLTLAACTSNSAVSCAQDDDCFTGESCNAGICAPADDDVDVEDGGDDTDTTDTSEFDAGEDSEDPDSGDTTDGGDVSEEADSDTGFEIPERPDDPWFRDECTRHNSCGGCDTLNLNGNPGDYDMDESLSLVCTDVNDLTWLPETPNSLELRLSWDHPELSPDDPGASAVLILCRDDALSFGDEERCVHTGLGSTVPLDNFEPAHVDISGIVPLSGRINYRYPRPLRYHVGVEFVESRDDLRALRAQVVADVYTQNDAVLYPRFYESGWLGQPDDVWYAGTIDWRQPLPNAKYTPVGASFQLASACDAQTHQRCGSSERFFTRESTNVWDSAP